MFSCSRKRFLQGLHLEARAHIYAAEEPCTFAAYPAAAADDAAEEEEHLGGLGGEGGGGAAAEHSKK